MKTAYKYLLFLGINISLSIIIRLLFGISLLSSIGSNSIYGFAILFTLLGVLFGFLISLFFNNKQFGKPYWLGLVISSVLQGAFAFSFSYQQNIYSSNENRIEQNNDVLDKLVRKDEQYVRKAFERLETSYDPSNQMRLNSFYILPATYVPGRKDSTYHVYFTYNLKNSSDKQKLSKFAVHKNQVETELIDVDPTSDAEFQRLKERLEKEVIHYKSE